MAREVGEDGTGGRRAVFEGIARGTALRTRFSDLQACLFQGEHAEGIGVVGAGHAEGVLFVQGFLFVEGFEGSEGWLRGAGSGFGFRGPFREGDGRERDAGEGHCGVVVVVVAEVD